MKYSNSIKINLPREQMVKLLDNPENMKHWQQGLQSYELLSDKPSQVGAQMKLKYQMGKRKIEMIETITKNDFPNQFDATYETKGVWNKVENHFQENSDGTTTWVSDCEFKFSGMMKVMSWFMPKSMFSKQSCQYLQDFKAFAESGKTS